MNCLASRADSCRIRPLPFNRGLCGLRVIFCSARCAPRAPTARTAPKLPRASCTHFHVRSPCANMLTDFPVRVPTWIALARDQQKVNAYASKGMRALSRGAKDNTSIGACQDASIGSRVRRRLRLLLPRLCRRCGWMAVARIQEIPCTHHRLRSRA